VYETVKGFEPELHTLSWLHYIVGPAAG